MYIWSLQVIAQSFMETFYKFFFIWLDGNVQEEMWRNIALNFNEGDFEPKMIVKWDIKILFRRVNVMIL